MKTRVMLFLFLLLIALCVPALAAKSPACEQMGSAKAAAHLVTHIYALTCGWDGESESFSDEDGCGDYGHVHCYGRRVSMWDTPKKGKNILHCYAGHMSGRIGPDTPFELVDVVMYRNKFYANIRVMDENGLVSNSGFVDADYIGCDCASYEAAEPIPLYGEYGEYIP